MKELFIDLISQNLISCIISNPRQSQNKTKKYKIRPVIVQEKHLYQLEEYQGTQVIHQNLEMSACIDFVSSLVQGNLYKQLDFYTVEKDIHILLNKKGEPHIKEGTPTMEQQSVSHNRKKEYILEEGLKIPFLIQLGIMTQDGKVIAKKYDKFRQINRYLEMVEDILPMLAELDPIRIIDFGCGKSYLTFALYHYLVEIKKLPVTIIGLDLKSDVILHCNQLAEKLSYQHLSFSIGNIAEYDSSTRTDMVITLHACDTATDFALQKAVKWGAKVILSVPCCQHELNTQIQCPPLSSVLQYGLIKERISALMTDAIRANYLALQGYSVQILEFIDLEHTPKNILIRAIKSSAPLAQDSQSYKEYHELQNYLNAQLTISKG